MTSTAGRGRASDAELLRLFAATRDDGAFAELVSRHGPMVAATCRRVLAGSPEADDAAQATFLVLAKKAGGVRDPDRLGAWLHGVATRCALRARSRLARRRSRESPMPESVAAAELAPTSSDWAPLLDAELARLPEAFRTPLVLCELEGVGRSEAAARLGIPEGTLASRLARGKAKLKRRLVRRGVALPAAGVGAILSEAKASAAPALTGQVPGAGLSSAPAISIATQEILAMLSSMLAKLLLPILLAAGVATGLYFADEPPAAPAKAQSDEDAAAKAELARLAGEWKIAAAKCGGKAVEGDQKKELVGKPIIFDGDKMTFRGATGDIRVQPGKSPKEIGSWGPMAGRKDRSFTGIYKLEADRLTIHMFEAPAESKGVVIMARPKDFEPVANGLTLLLVLDRAKK